MPNNNVAILSIMSKFDEKSAREAAKRADKVYEEALSDIGNVNFDEKLIDNFDKAMNLLKNKFKKVNLSSYTNSLLDSIFSDKDIKEKSKDIELFISKIEMLKKASSGQDVNAFNTFSEKQINALISRTEKLAQKQEEINEKTIEYDREAAKIAKANRSISTIDKNYGNQDYSKTLESLKKSLGTEKEFTVEQNQSIENLAKMVNLYQIMEKSEPQKGTAEAIRYSKDLLAVTQKIKEERDKIDAFSQKGASTYITNNELSSVDEVSIRTVNKSKDNFVKANLSNLKSQEAKLQSELTTYISESVQKNLVKVSKEVDAVVDKAEKRVENLQNKIDSLQTKSTKIGSDDSIIDNIVSETDIKSLEEIEDRLYAISDLDAEGEATKQQLKEYIQLYKQYEQLIASDSTVKFDPGLKDEYDFILESDSKLKKYADTLDETISKQKELNTVKSNENEVSVDTQTEQLVKQEEQIKETIQAEKQLQDTQEKVSSNTKISVDAEQAIADINKIKENLDSIPNEKNIKINVSSNDYSNTPLLSDAEGNTITAFRGVVNAWSGLINQDGIGFFTDKLKLAADYADSLAESGKVYQANLSFKNPLEVEGNGAKWDEIDFNGVKKTTDEIVELAKQLGHDGVIFKNIRDGFTDTDEDISNVMVALNAAQIKNEQVIGTVKAGTGEMVDVASKIDNATDTATNSTVESQNKIQEELKETQKVAEQVSEAMNNVSSDKSLIDSSATITEVKKTVNALSLLEKASKMRNDGEITDYDSNDYNFSRKMLDNRRKEVEELQKQLNKFSGDKANSEFRSLQENLENLKVEFLALYSCIEDSFPDKINLTNGQGVNKSVKNLYSSIIQEELKETQKQAEQTSEALSKIVDVDKSNISLENVNAENELKLLQEKKKILSSLQEEYDEEEISEMTQIKSYQEILELVTKIRDLKSDMTVTKGKMSGARQINDSNLAKQYEDEASSIRKQISSLEDAMPLLIAFEDLTKQTLTSFKTDDELNKFALELYQCLINLRGELGLINAEDFSKISSEINSLKDSVVKIPEKKKIEIELEYKSMTPDGELAYRGIAGKDGNYLNVSNDDGAVWWTSQKDLSQTRYTRNGTGSEFSGNLKAKNLFEFTSASTNWQKATYLGDGIDELSVKITDLYNRIEVLKSRKEELIKTSQIESQEYKDIAIELGSLEAQYNAISNSKSNMYGTHMPNDWVRIAKQNGYDGLAIHGIDDDTGNIATSYAVWAKEQIENVKLVAESEEEFIRIHNEFLESTSTTPSTSKTPIKDVFQGDDKVNTDASSTAIKEESQALEQVSTSAKDAASSKEKFVDANKEVKVSAESSSTSLDEEKKKFENVGDSAEETKKKLDDVIFKPNTEGFDEIVSKLDIAKDKIEEISKITKSSVWSESQGEYLESYNIKYKNGTSEIRGESSNKKGSNVLRANEVAYDAKAELQESKRLVEENIRLNKAYYDSKKQEEIEYQKLRAKYISEGKAQEKNFYESRNSIVKTLAYQTSTINTLKKLNKGGTSTEFNYQLDIIKTKLKEINNYGDLSKLVDSKDIENVSKLQNELNLLLTAIKGVDKGSKNVSIGKLINNISKYMAENTKMTKPYKNQLQGLIDTLKELGNNADVSTVTDQFVRLQTEIREAGQEGQNLISKIKKQFSHGVAQGIAMFFSFYDLIRYIREGMNTIKEFDTALTEMRKVSDETVESLKNYQVTTFDIANTTGSTAKSIQDSTADYMRLGKSLTEASKLAQDTSILMNVSEFENIDDATESLISMTQAYQELDDMQIIDKLNLAGNNFSISTSDLAQSLQKSSAALKVAGNDFNEAIALTVAGNSILQDPDSVAAGIRTISLRITGTKEAKSELESLGEDVDDFVVGTASKLDEKVRGFTSVASNNFKGISLLDENGNYRSTYEILQDIADIWEEIGELDKQTGDNRKNGLLELLAGKNRSNVLASILNDGNLLRDVFTQVQNADGSAQKELDKYLDSIDGKMQQLSNEAQRFWFNFLNSETVKDAISLVTKVLSYINTIIEKFGTLPLLTMGGIFGADIFVKKETGGGRAKTISLLSNKYASEELTVRFTRLYYKYHNVLLCHE